VVLPRDASEVAEAVAWATARGLRVALQSTGHSASALGPLGDTLLVKTERMRGVEVDPAERVARVGAGVRWEQVVAAAAAHGLAPLAGTSRDVGVAGYTLGGGISWLGRRYGLAANRVRSIDAVLADGRHVRASAQSEPELFWALRGGGGSFAAVTALEIELLPIRTLLGGALFFGIERAREVLGAWREWTAGVGDEVTSIARIKRFPAFDSVPAPLRGRAFAIVEAAVDGDAPMAAAEALLAPLSRLGAEAGTFRRMAPNELLDLHMDPPGPVPGVTDHQLLRDVDAGTSEAIAERVGDRCGSPLGLDLRHLGGALGRPVAGGGALSSIDAPYAMFAVGPAPAPEVAAAVRAELGELRAALAPWDAGREYLNFAEHRDGVGKMFEASIHRRLAAVKRAYDPADRVQANHQVHPAQ
jgi:hypothetical protein